MTAPGASAHVLRSADGVDLLRYRETAGLALAEVTEVLAPVDAVVPAVLQALAGWQVSSRDDSLVDALVAAGARQTRFAHLYSRDLRADPPDPAWLRPSLPGRVAITAHTPESTVAEAQLAVRAYPQGHVDQDTTDPLEAGRILDRLYDGEYIGPVLAPSAVVSDDSRVVAVMVVNRMPGEPPSGGPWVSEVFRDPHPAYAGLGSRLLRRAMAMLAADGERSLSLVVTDGNPARALYERLGFAHAGTTRKVTVPA